MSRLFINAKSRIYHLADCGHLVRGPEGEPCPLCEPLAVTVDEMEKWGLVEQCPDTEPAPATSTEDEDLQALLDQVATTGEMPQ